MSNRLYWYGNFISKLEPNQIFVYGANPEFRNGAGAAKVAQNFGAKPYGSGRGIVGQTFGIITKNLKPGYYERATGITYPTSGERSVSPEQIISNIKELYQCAKENPDKRFLITYQHELDNNGVSKKSLNGYTGKEMADMLLDHLDVPDNIVFHESYKPLVEQKLKAKQHLQEKRNRWQFHPRKAEEMEKINKQIKHAKLLGLYNIVSGNNSYTPFFKSNNIFSQWHPSLFTYKDKTFISCEQFMMYSKAKLFGDEDVAFKILDFNEGSTIARRFIEGHIDHIDIVSDKEMRNKWNDVQDEIKKLGRKVSNFHQSTWDKKSISIVQVANREKFNQNDTLRQHLVNLGNSTLVEASPYDKIWGCGLSKDDKNITNPHMWTGKNQLGYILTELKNKYQQHLKFDQEPTPATRSRTNKP